jgi:hypothetical protein
MNTRLTTVAVLIIVNYMSLIAKCQEIAATKGSDIVASIRVEAATKVFQEVGITTEVSTLVACEVDRRWSVGGADNVKRDMGPSPKSSIVIVTEERRIDCSYTASRLGETSLMHIKVPCVDPSAFICSVVLTRSSLEALEILGFEVRKSSEGKLVCNDVKIKTITQKQNNNE